MKRIFLLSLILLACSATQSEGIRVENRTYRFAFTFPADTELKYEENGVGMVATHLPSGSKKSDYGLLVYGSPGMLLSAAEATAIGYAEHEAVLSAVDVADQDEWLNYLSAIMEARGHAKAGEALVLTGNEKLKVPYYIWQQELLGTPRHALMYVVKHGEAFVYVQVESNTALSKANVDWFTTNLELLSLPATAPPQPIQP